MSEMQLQEITHARIRVERRLREKGWGDSEVYPFLSWIVETRFPEKGMITHPAMEDIERGLEALIEEFSTGKAPTMTTERGNIETLRKELIRVTNMLNTAVPHGPAEPDDPCPPDCRRCVLEKLFPRKSRTHFDHR